jgi:hypothetical protein
MNLQSTNGIPGEMHPSLTLVDDLEKCNDAVESSLQSSKPVFLARFGGSDADLLIDLHHLSKTFPPSECLELAAERIEILQRYNGYYDLRNGLDGILDFCKLLIDSFQLSSNIFLVGGALLSEFLPNSIHDQFKVSNGSRAERIQSFVSDKIVGSRQVNFLPYSYIERLTLGTTIFALFSKVLVGKRVLVVSPFKDSIEYNFHNRRNFFRNFDYPEFNLLTYETPITYPGLPREFYPDGNWFQTVNRMQSEIAKLDFDVALLSCGSYAMPIGAFIADTMKKDSIYIGGCLQLFFGVIGRRYENPFFVDQIRREYFIRPRERDKFLRHIDITPQTALEAFGAYF